jgi:cation-transporting ATPase 13A1
MVYAVRIAKSYLPPDYAADLDGEFKPGILNTVVFLVSSVQQVTVFFVNIQGRPFMTGISENRPLIWSLAATFILTFMFASESVPQMNRYFQLVPFPDESFRDFFLVLLGLDLLGTFIFDRLMKFVFAREILTASIKSTTWNEVFSLAKTFAIIGFLMKIFLGNDSTWEEMIAIEEALKNGTGSASIVTNATECIEGVCVALNETVNAAVSSVQVDEL